LKQRSRSLLLHLYSIGVGLAGMGALAILAGRVPWTQVGLPLVFFALLSLIIKRAGFHVTPGVTHSLVSMVDVATLLIFGPVAGGTVALISGLAYLLLRAFRHQTRPWIETLEAALFNAGLKALMALASGWLYTLAGGGDFLVAGLSDVFPLLVLFATWFTLDHLGWGLREGIQGGPRQAMAFLRAVWPTSLLVELCPLDVDQLCELIYQQASQIVDTSSFHLGLFDGDTYTLKIWVRDNVRQPSQSFPRAANEGIIGWMRRSKQPLLVRDFQQEMDALPARPSYASEHPPRSAIFVPLIAGEEVIGTMSIQSYTPAAFSEDDLRLLSVIGNEAAMAIEKARLYAMAQRRARQLALIGDVSRKVAAILELEELFTQVVHLIQETFGYYHVGIFAIDPDTKIIGWVAQEGQPLLANDVSTEPRFRHEHAWPQTRAELAVPLKVEERVLGVLDVQSNETGAFSDDDLFILQTLAAQVAIAIEDARLYAAQQEEVWVTTALLQVAEATSKLSNLDDVLATVVRLTPLLAGVDRCSIFLWDRNAQVFLPAQAHGLTREQKKLFSTLRFAPGDALALDEVRLTKSPRILSGDELASSMPSTMIEMFDIRNLLILPLLARGKVVGVMLVGYIEESAGFTARKVSMISGIANQAAIAIENAQLYAAQQEEAYVSTALLQVAEAVGSRTDLEDILSTVVRITPILVGVKRCTIFLWDDDEGVFVPAQAYGLSEDQKEWFWHSRPGQDDPLDRMIH